MPDLIAVSIEKWPKILSRYMDISGKTFSKCTHNAGMFEARFCDRTAIAVIYFKDSGPQPSICHMQVCSAHFRRARKAMRDNPPPISFGIGYDN